MVELMFVLQYFGYVLHMKIVPFLLVTGCIASAELVGQQLPAGSQEMHGFGAVYARLSYTPEWDSVWRVSDHADVVVHFECLPVRFVFWRGTSYIPCWVSENGIWYTNEFVERNAAGGRSGIEGCAEPMSDKQCRFSHVRIIESTDARAVVHWRYSPVDVHYRHPWVDDQSGWGDWVDEYYTIYPDGVATRKVLLHTSAAEEWTEWFEGIVINQPGTFPDDNIEPEAVTIGNLEGTFKTYAVDKDGLPVFTDQPDQPCILRINLKADYQPFAIFDIGEPTFTAYRGHAPGQHFNFWNHWPVAQEKSWTTVAMDAVKPSHTSLLHARGWRVHEQSGNTITKVMLHGMIDGTEDQLVKLANSWMHPPEMTVLNNGGLTVQYDPAQRAYVIDGYTENAGVIECAVDATHDQPLVNPGLLLKNWTNNEHVEMWLGDQKLVRGTDFEVGSVRRLDGKDLAIWLPVTSEQKVKIKIVTGEN
jgi:hypothetical protein